jgi:hypothetical protein
MLLQLLQHYKVTIYNARELNFKDNTNHLSITFSPWVCSMDVLYMLDMLHICLLDENVHTHNLITLGKTSILSLRKESFPNLISPKAKEQMITAHYIARNTLPFIPTPFGIH